MLMRLASICKCYGYSLVKKTKLKFDGRKQLTLFWQGFSGIIIFIMVIWIVEIANAVSDYRLSYLGIDPRSITGLPGILLSPLIHHGIEHVAMNTVPILILGLLMSVKYNQHLFRISLFIIIFGGLAVWLLGRPSLHVGASGLIFGYFGFLLAGGLYGRNVGSLLIAVITVLLYGSMIWGILPLQPYVSWEAHLFGFISGVVAARIFIINK